MCCNQNSCCACEAYAYRSTGYVPEQYWLTSTSTKYTPYFCCMNSYLSDYMYTNPWSTFNNANFYLQNISRIYNN